MPTRRAESERYACLKPPGDPDGVMGVVIKPVGLTRLEGEETTIVDNS